MYSLCDLFTHVILPPQIRLFKFGMRYFVNIFHIISEQPVNFAGKRGGGKKSFFDENIHFQRKELFHVDKIMAGQNIDKKTK